MIYSSPHKKRVGPVISNLNKTQTIESKELNDSKIVETKKQPKKSKPKVMTYGIKSKHTQSKLSTEYITRNKFALKQGSYK